MPRIRLRRWGFPAVAAIALACAGYNAAAPTGPGGNNNPGVVPAGNTLNVQVQDGSFEPAADTVALNSTVTWTWNAGPHNVTFQDGPASDNQSSGSYQRTFSGAGTYAYRCTLHSSSFTSGMTGTIVVR